MNRLNTYYFFLILKFTGRAITNPAKAPTTVEVLAEDEKHADCLLYTSPSPRDGLLSRMPSSA